MPRRHRKMKGGFLDSLGSTLSGWGSSISQGASSAWSKTKSATTGAYDSATGTPTTYTPTPTTSSTTTSTETYNPSYTPTMGGKKTKRRHRKMSGGFSDNTPTTGLAANAAPISGIKSAQPHNWVGGKTKRHRKSRHSKSRRHRKH